DAGNRYFIRIQPAENAPDLENIYFCLKALAQQNHMSQVVAPLLTRGGAAVIPVDDYHLSIFPYIAGHTLYEQRPDEVDLENAAVLLAHLHQAPLTLLPLPRETFDHPFRAPIEAALAAARQPLAQQTRLQRAVCQLLMAEHEDILATLTYMERLRTQIEARPIDWVLTHGDPNLDNVIKDAGGQLHLVDWGDMAIGPAERDLMHWTGAAFEPFLRQYARRRPGLTLDADLFTFYFYRWCLQEIADYAPRILFEALGATEDAHAWDELQDYLPIRHESMAAGVQAVVAIMRRVL
ncbi:MAG: aminoglycoside phosphotransferase family protein, partial [Caldilineaceae bacterium]|nr:aminoglycoside phosphotransferase family protein [Caldilineaceae bacterium]